MSRESGSLDLRADMFNVFLTTARRVTCNSRCPFGFEGQNR